MTDDTSRDSILPSQTAFFLDVDGTLLGFRNRPDDVVADAALRTLLADLYAASGQTLALVSGRTIADLDRIMAPLILPAAGTHGAEIRYTDGRTSNHQCVALDDLRASMIAYAAAHPGLTLEDKGPSIAIHYRAAPESKDDIVAFLDRVVTHPDLMVQHGQMVADVKAASHSKATAIEMLMTNPPFAGRTPIFIGDDLTDEHGFDAVNRLDGISIKVGPGDTIAKRRLEDVDAVRRFLGQALQMSAS